MKRILDIIFSIVILILFSPIFLLISLLILVLNGRPIIYKQKRVGQNWENFNIYKFRTMVRGADEIGPNLSSEDDSRVTNFGRFLRKYKIDELPQFFNVLFGNMSIVGPRPEVFEYAIKYREDFDFILKVKPGISDFASIKFRNESLLLAGVPNKEAKYINEILPAKIDFSKQYISSRNTLIDLKVILLTIFSIIK